MNIRTDLDHLPEDKQRYIKTIRDVILNDFDRFLVPLTGKKKTSKIKHIILFGSYAKGEYVDAPQPTGGYISDYDVLVTLNNKNLLEEYELWHNIEDKAERHVPSPINLIVHTATEVIRRLKEGQYFFKDIQQDGIYLYSCDGTGLPQPKLLSIEDRKPIAQKHYDQWFTTANEFLEFAEIAMEKSYSKKAAFELHQAAEHYYGTLLLVLTNYKPRTHNIKHLHPLSVQYAKEIETVFHQDTKFKRRSFNLLKRAYIDARYSEHYTITEEELNWLIDQVKQLKSIVETTCKEHIQSLG